MTNKSSVPRKRGINCPSGTDSRHGALFQLCQQKGLGQETAGGNPLYPEKGVNFADKGLDQG